MKLTINKINIKNFRNINEMELSFTDGYNEIKAENGKGKTNTLSAIMWCLFGKDIYNNKLFVISPIIDGEERNDITTNVTLTINDNYVVSRTYYQRKTTIATGYIIDGKQELVNITQSQFTDELKEKFGFDEDTFKSLSNINYIPNLNWKDLKELIFNLIGEVKDEEVLLKGNFSHVEEQIRLMGINSTQDSLNKSDKALNDEIRAKETEYQTLVNTKDKYVVNDDKQKELIARRDEISKEISNIESKKKEYLDKLAEYNEQKEIINIQQYALETTKTKVTVVENYIKDLEEQYKLNGSVSIDTLKQQERNYIQNKINIINERLTTLDTQTKQYEDELEKTKEKGKELQEKEIKIENDKCSTCGQTLPQEKIEEALSKLKEQQIEELTRLQQKVDSLKTIVSANSAEYEKKVEELKNLTDELNNVDNKEFEVEEETEKQKEIRIKKESYEIELKRLVEDVQQQRNIVELEQDKLSSIELPTEEDANIDELNSELNEINDKLATTTTLAKMNEDIEKVNKELQNKRNEKNVIKEKLNSIIKFNNIKADMVREKAKSHFNIVDFKTKEYTQDGTEQETFKICINGVDYKELNTGMKIYVAIDLLSGIQKMKDIYVPIICDNLENFTGEISIDNTQVIVARAVKGVKEIEVLKC